jgi:hypothetical protein
LSLSGTHHEISDDILERITIPSDAGNILWVSGVASSTIATSIGASFRALGRLGAFFLFDRTDQARSHPDNVIRTIAYQLAVSSPHIASTVSAAIRRDPALPDAPLRTQFKALVLDPLLAAEQHIMGPIIVILGALDECGDAGSRLPLLSLLSDEFPKLPACFRVLVTSRREVDIVQRLGSRCEEMSLDPSSDSSNEDANSGVRRRRPYAGAADAPEHDIWEQDASHPPRQEEPSHPTSSASSRSNSDDPDPTPPSRLIVRFEIITDLASHVSRVVATVYKRLTVQFPVIASLRPASHAHRAIVTAYHFVIAPSFIHDESAVWDEDRVQDHFQAFTSWVLAANFGFFG